jgi:O-antigen/teichoic acid export membrane protein
VAVLASLNVSIPRYSVEHFLGEGALGYFAAAAYVQVACNTVIIAAEQSASPRLAQFCASPRKAFLSLLTKMLLLAGVLGAGGVSVAFFFGRPLLAFLYRPDYARYGGMFTLLMLAGGLNYVVSMLCCAMTVLRMFRVQMILSFISTATILMGSWLLVPRFGLMGAAYAVLGTAIVSCLGTVFLSVEAWHPKTSEW